MAQTVVSLPLHNVRIGPRLRAVDADYVALLAASMAETGQHTPIHVGPADAEGMHPLIAGAHRCAAAAQAGLTEILALVFEGNALEQRMLEIDENLMRRELCELDRAVFLAERKALYEALHPETRRGGDRRTDQTEENFRLVPKQESFAAETAKKLGVSDRQIRTYLARARIQEAARQALAGTRWADHGATLDAIAKLPPEQQMPVVATLLALQQGGAAASVATAVATVQGVVPRVAQSDSDAAHARLLGAWRKADAKARASFLAYILDTDSPIRLLVSEILEAQETGERRVVGAIGKGRAA